MAWVLTGEGHGATTGDVITYNGTDFVPQAPSGGGGAVELIDEVVTSSSQATVTFSSIPTTYRDLLIVVRGRSNRAGTNNDEVRLQFNGDTGNNYEYARTGRAISSAFSDGNATQGSAWIGSISAATSTANLPGLVEATIGDYNGTTFHKVVNGGSTAGGSGDTFTAKQGAIWRNTAAITSVVVLMVSTFVDGSVVSLYGRS